MELNEIEKAFGTEQQCREYIYGIRWKDGYRCPRCQSNKAWKTSELKYKCQNCGYKASVTSGTIFQDSHIPLPLWFKAIWFVSQNPQGITANDLQQKLELGSNRTSQTMLHKIKRTMINTKLDTLSGKVELVTRDIKVRNQKAFVAMAVEINNRKTGKIRIKRLDRDDRLGLVEFISECIEPNSTIIHREMMLSGLLLYDEYTQLRKPEAYMFSCTRKVIIKLEHWLYDHYSEGKLNRCLNEFCARVNSMKSEYSFYDLLNNAVKLKPVSGKSQQFGIEIK